MPSEDFSPNYWPSCKLYFRYMGCHPRYPLLFFQASQHPHLVSTPSNSGHASAAAAASALAPTVDGLTWDCSAEFDATVGQAVSFVEEDAFISFPNWISRTGAMVSFDVSAIECLSCHVRCGAKCEEVFPPQMIPEPRHASAHGVTGVVGFASMPKEE